MSQHDDLLRHLDQRFDALHAELRTLRTGQLKLAKNLFELRHALHHRLSTTREDLGALVKASHTELAQQLHDVIDTFDDQRQRLDALEQDLDHFFDGPQG